MVPQLNPTYGLHHEPVRELVFWGASDERVEHPPVSVIFDRHEFVLNAQKGIHGYHTFKVGVDVDPSMTPQDAITPYIGAEGARPETQQRSPHAVAAVVLGEPRGFVVGVVAICERGVHVFQRLHQQLHFGWDGAVEVSLKNDPRNAQPECRSLSGGLVFRHGGQQQSPGRGTMFLIGVHLELTMGTLQAAKVVIIDLALTRRGVCLNRRFSDGVRGPCRCVTACESGLFEALIGCCNAKKTGGRNRLVGREID